MKHAACLQNDPRFIQSSGNAMDLLVRQNCCIKFGMLVKYTCTQRLHFFLPKWNMPHTYFERGAFHSQAAIFLLDLAEAHSRRNVVAEYEVTL